MFRSIPIVTKNLLIINVLAFLATLILKNQGIDLEEWGALHFFLAKHFYVWQFISYQFLHGSFTHLFFNMFALWMFGCVIENVWGPRKFLFYYLVCGVGAGLCQEVVQYVQYASENLAGYDFVAIDGVGRMAMDTYLDRWCTIGASGAVYAILLAFGMTFPNERIFIFPLPVPIKAKWFVCIYVAIELFSAWSSSGDGVAHVAHLGGMLFGLLLILYWRKHPDSLNIDGGLRLFDRTRRTTRQQPTTPPRTATREDDMEYNRRKRELQDEVDAILDKIRKSGYDSLTREEKQRLFEASRER